MIANAHPGIDLPTGPYATRALAGPYRSIDDWCTDFTRRLNDDARAEELRQYGDDSGFEPDASLGCLRSAPVVSRGVTHLGPSGGAITAVALAPTNVFDDSWGPRCALVLHAGDRIWADESVMPCLRPDGATTLYHDVDVDELVWRDLITAAPRGEALGDELVLRFQSTRESGSGVDVHTAGMIVCGAGESGIPRCTLEIPIESEGPTGRVAYHPAIAADGSLRFAVEDREDVLDPSDLASFDQPHLLRFP